MTLVKNNAKTLNGLFDDFFGFPSYWGKDAQSAWHTPAVNVHEDKEAFHLEMNAPGRKKEDFAINVENGTLTISFEQKEATEKTEYKTLRREFSYTSFKRSFSLDDQVNTDGIQARYEDGILRVLLPKKTETKISAKQIVIA
ncbi:MAG: Hsp20/alpha crystallin family protein [Sphingobacteriia bacterium]|nr:Hsp20/alpha crystallin family protein [Sphingobacteriia bacterium]